MTPYRSFLTIYKPFATLSVVFVARDEGESSLAVIERLGYLICHFAVL